MSQLSLLKTKRFLPLFLTQFLGAFNDNLYKNALVILIIYVFSREVKIDPEILITIAAGIFILPFFIFSAFAGQLADKFEKAKLICFTKIAEIILMLLAAIGFYSHQLNLLMVILFLLGMQATFFGPIKYAILPEQLDRNELIAGNALLEASTFMAILLGTILGGIVATFKSAPQIIASITITSAVLGFIISLWIPNKKSSDPQLKMTFNLILGTCHTVADTFKDQVLLRIILAISWFWLVGTIYLTQLPIYVSNILLAESTIVTLLLVIFTTGIGIGALCCNQLVKGKIKLVYSAYAVLGMAFFGTDLVITSYYSTHHLISVKTLATFIADSTNWHILLDLLGLSICGGIYVVPLYAALQITNQQKYCSRIIASNNIFNALFMVLAALLTSGLLFLHFTILHIFLVSAGLNFTMGYALWRQK